MNCHQVATYKRVSKNGARLGATMACDRKNKTHLLNWKHFFSCSVFEAAAATSIMLCILLLSCGWKLYCNPYLFSREWKNNIEISDFFKVTGNVQLWRQNIAKSPNRLRLEQNLHNAKYRSMQQSYSKISIRSFATVSKQHAYAAVALTGPSSR